MPLITLQLPLYAIVADTATGRTITCFSWRGLPAFGVMRAKREAEEFGMFDLHNFRAVRADEQSDAPA